MHQPDIEKWISEHLNALLTEYALTHWEIIIEYVYKDDADFKGQTTMFQEMNRAYIELNVPCFVMEGEAGLENTVRHELEHLVHAPFTGFMELIKAAIPEGKDVFMALLRQSFVHAAEATRVNIHRMHKAHVERYSSRD